MIILASASPRRSEILSNAGLEFTVRVSDADETLGEGVSAFDAVQIISRRKAEAVKNTASEGDVIIAADTVVELCGTILGKPRNNDEACKMLTELSGKTHNVYTGVTLLADDKCESFAVKTAVKFFELSREEIESYVATGEPADKAGAYGIQGRGCLLVEKIDGDYFNVMGLPVSEAVRRIKAMTGGV